MILLLFVEKKRKRSDSVLWQKPLHQQKCQKGKVTTQTTPQKSSIKQRLRTDLGRSVGVTKATQLVWLTGLRIHLTNNVLFNPNSKTFLFGMLPLKDASIPYNSILLTVKYYIYKSKCFNNVPDMFGLLNDMKNLYITSKIISIKNGRYHWFETNWNTWSFLEDC